MTFEGINFHALGQIIANFTRGSIAEREDAIRNLPGTQTGKDQALANCRHSLRAWCAKKPRRALHAITDDEEGRPLDDADDSGARLCSQWREFFEARVDGDQDLSCETVLTESSRCYPVDNRQ